MNRCLTVMLCASFASGEVGCVGQIGDAPDPVYPDAQLMAALTGNGGPAGAHFEYRPTVN
jgi:hypothetical protein